MYAINLFDQVQVTKSLKKNRASCVLHGNWGCNPPGFIEMRSKHLEKEAHRGVSRGIRKVEFKYFSKDHISLFSHPR